MDDSRETERVPDPEQSEMLEAGSSLRDSCPPPGAIKLRQKH